MINDRACQWAAALDRGLDAEERAALDAWLAADRRHRGALLRAQAALSLLDRGRALAPRPTDAPEESEETEVDSDPALSPSIDRRQLLRFGGGGLAAAILGALTFRLWPRGVPIDTDIGEIRRMPLADGSVAVVNSASRVRVAFTRDRRDVELSHGEAWFEVAKNRNRPFTVKAGDMRVQAVGTAFDVRHLDDAPEVLVTEGTVRVWSAVHDAPPILVSAGHRAVADAQAGIEVAPVAAVASDKRLAWREGRIVLDDMTLAEAAVEFNRYHAEELVVDPALADKRVIGWFRIDDLDGFANASAAMVGGRVKRERNVVRIVP